MADTDFYTDKYLLADFDILVGGRRLPEKMISDILEVTIEESLHYPAACTMRLFAWDVNTNEFTWDDHPDLQPGKEIIVKMGYTNKLDELFDGEITAIEMDAAGHMVPTLIVRCVDRGHRLHRNRVQETYQDVTDSDVVAKVASRCGLSKDIDATTNQFKWICQNNQTDYEFIKMLADRNGYRAYVQKKKLCFKKVKEAEGADATVEWGETLRSFRPRLTTHGQVEEVTVRGWDPQEKQAIIGKAKHNSAVKSRTIGEGKTGYNLAKDFGGAKSTIVDWPVHSQGEADALAKSYMEKRETTSVEADGLCVGNTKIRAGKTVEVKHAGTRFSGKYVVTSTTHTMTPAEGYTTQFACSGKSPHTLLGLLQGEKGDQDNQGGNIVVAIVTNNVDPEHHGRIKVKYPWLSDTHESYWVRIAAPMAGPDRGFYFLPEVNDEVLVAFEHGDIHRAYMIGALWNGKDAPVEKNEVAVAGGKVIHRVIKTRKGHIVMLQDTDNEEQVKITTYGNHYLLLDDTKNSKKCEIKTDYGHTVLLDDQNKLIEVKTKKGHTLKMEDNAEKITLVDDKGVDKITIDANSGDIKVECIGKFTVDAMKGIEFNTPQQMKGTAMAGIEWTTSASYQVTAGASMSITVGASLAIASGASTSVTSGATLSMRATLITLN